MKLDKKSIRIQILDLQDEKCAGCEKCQHTGSQGIVRLPGVRITVGLGSESNNWAAAYWKGEMKRWQSRWLKREIGMYYEKAEKLREQKLSWAKLQIVLVE